jgi:probable phosphoglycerate mutase
MVMLFLIRHGENDYFKDGRLPGRLPGVHLNDRGRQQAEAIALSLGPVPFKAVYASPLERARETAEPLAAARSLEVRILPELADIEVGEWTGRRWKSLQRTPAWKTVQDHPSQFRFPGGESFTEVQQRIVEALEAVRSACGVRGAAAVIFHADPIKLALAHYLGQPLDAFQRLQVRPGSLSLLALNGGRIQILGVNWLPPFSLPAFPQASRRSAVR